MKDMSITQWIAIVSGVLLALQSLKVIDLSKFPVLGQLLVNLKLIPAPAGGVSSSDNAAPLVAGETTTHKHCCEDLQNSMKRIRHFLSEQPAGESRDLLLGCDKIDEVILKSKNATAK